MAKPLVTSDPDLYRCRGIAVIPVDGERALLTTLADRDQVLVDSNTAKLAASCQTFASLHDHAAAAGRADHDMVAALQGLVDAGVLVSKQRFVELLREGPADASPQVLRTIAMPTCNRVDAMVRGLRGYLANAIRFGHPVRAIVADDSRDERDRDRCRAALTSLAREYDREIVYAGSIEKKAFIDRLTIESGIERAALDVVLFGPQGSGATYGGNRNALYLASAGEAFASADDDTIADFIVPDDVAPGIVVSSEYDPTHVRMALPGAPLPGTARDVDLFAIHRSVLGRGIAELVADTEVDFDACDASLMGALERGDAHVRVSWTGIAGDAGSRSSLYYLRQPHCDRTPIRTDDDYRAYVASTRILRAPPRLVIGTGGYCQTTALAFDAATLLPPFPPSEHGEDIVFGAMLRRIQPESLTAYHAVAVGHQPVDDRVVAPPRSDAAYTPLYEILTALLPRFETLPGTIAPSARLEAVGAYFAAIGQLPFGDLAMLVRDACNAAAIEQIQSLEHHLGTCDGLPPAYREGVRLSIECVVETVGRDVFPSDASSRINVLARLRRQIGSYGRLCIAWPEIVAASRAAIANDRGLGVRV